MHILVTNDDGPPSEQHSPYILPFVRALESAGHLVSVVVPDVQRSWIGKAHIVGQDVTAKPYFPPSSSSPQPSESASSSSSPRPWMLINSTPAACSQLGLFHLFNPSTTSLPPIDYVVSGPNYGRNTSAVFALSSGTLGAALEAAVSGYPSVALSFAFFDRRANETPQIVGASCKHAVKVVEYLYHHGGWDERETIERIGLKGGEGVERENGGGRNKGGRVFSVNVPVKEGVEKQKVLFTGMLQNRWSESCFDEESRGGAEDPGESEEQIRDREESEANAEKNGGNVQIDGNTHGGKGNGGGQSQHSVRHFKWAPKFTDVYEAVLKAGPGSDGWAVKEGQTSITALRANFMHLDGFSGEVKL